MGAGRTAAFVATGTRSLTILECALEQVDWTTMLESLDGAGALLEARKTAA
jgi:hypothetical protein